MSEKLEYNLFSCVPFESIMEAFYANKNHRFIKLDIKYFEVLLLLYKKCETPTIHDIINVLRDVKVVEDFIDLIIQYFKIDGIAETWWPNGELRSKKSYQNGIRHGTCQTFNQFGICTSLITYRNNNGSMILHGPYKIYYDNGGIDIDTTYENGILSGSYRRYHYDGYLASEIFNPVKKK
jgi:antitoxin component YwqK of YwqJK toxin-antitoxin module